MCLIALALGMHPDYPLVIAANRDEFFDRPTAPMSEWLSGSGMPIIGGRDLRGGGAAMALSRKGRIAMPTNVRDPLDNKVYTRSRGELVLHWLESELPFDAWLNAAQAIDFAGFNLIVGDFYAKAWHWASNRSVSPEHAVQQAWPWHTKALPHGKVITLSNASLSTPWPKSKRLAAAMQTALGASADGAKPNQASMARVLWAALQDTQAPAQADLPTTGVDLALEKALASCFVDLRKQPNPYGTRSSSLIFGRCAGDGLDIHINEKSWSRIPSQQPETETAPVLAHYSLGWK